ncbi:MAG: SGNH/GDSL hydrolase family protein [Candidatus Berkelbacteria bacterium]|nr:MAG: SGNH/GDSL hydrolase family protein [Candidatus Berkelbacteria bacterium]QQG51382.1 MAG: SGNH/GDSL hydrolase family protein [Candidatus Berkelbacteria bacterium]
MKRVLLWLVAVIVLGGIITGGYFYWRSRQVTPSPSQPFNLLILGDSIAQGVGSVENDNTLETYITDSLRPRYGEFTSENKAVPGSKTEDVLNDQLTKLQREHYAALVIFIGTNDITHLVIPSKFEANYDAIAKILTAKADVVVLANIPQFSNTPIVPKSIQSIADYRTRSYNNKIDNIANSYSNMRMFNFYSFSQNRLHGETDYIGQDGFHPNDEGYKLIGEEIVQKILN